MTADNQAWDQAIEQHGNRMFLVTEPCDSINRHRVYHAMLARDGATAAQFTRMGLPPNWPYKYRNCAYWLMHRRRYEQTGTADGQPNRADPDRIGATAVELG